MAKKLATIAPSARPTKKETSIEAEIAVAIWFPSLKEGAPLRVLLP
jgi:hypothetical protein